MFFNFRFCFAHGGGAFPFTVGRIEHGYNVILNKQRALLLILMVNLFSVGQTLLPLTVPIRLKSFWENSGQIRLFMMTDA